jgi:DNA-binding HxlR family transcriptional regulator
MNAHRKSPKRRASRKSFQKAELICESLSDEDDAMTRELMTRLADKWSLWTLSVLASADGPIRFTRVREKVEGISQKSLTKALRQLERDGLATRKLFPQVPPRVEYGITPLGLELLLHVEPLWIWVAEKVKIFRAARGAFDRRKAGTGASFRT